MDALERYVHDLSSPEEELLHELDRQTHLRVVQPRMLSGISKASCWSCSCGCYGPATSWK